MLRINFPEDRDRLAKATSSSFHPNDPVIAHVRDDALLGGFVFSNFTGYEGTIWATVAGFEPGWLTKNFLIKAFDYPFVQCRCRSVLTRIAEDNNKSIDFCSKLGFNRTGRLDDMYPDGRGQIIFRMYRHECRWLPKEKILSGTVH